MLVYQLCNKAVQIEKLHFFIYIFILNSIYKQLMIFLIKLGVYIQKLKY